MVPPKSSNKRGCVVVGERAVSKSGLKQLKSKLKKKTHIINTFLDSSQQFVRNHATEEPSF
jgi:hypothetical protein